MKDFDENGFVGDFREQFSQRLKFMLNDLKENHLIKST